MYLKGDPLDYQGNKFWRSHFRWFWPIKYPSILITDFWKDKYYVPEIVYYLIALYLLNYSTVVIGTYDPRASCTYDLNSIPEDLEVQSKFSVYLHFYFIFMFVGNLVGVPTPITFLCLIVSIYNTLVRLYDVNFIQTRQCLVAPSDSFSRFIFTALASVQVIFQFLISIQYLAILVTSESRKRILQYVQPLTIIIIWLQMLFAKIFSCNWGFAVRFRQFLLIKITYPVRIKAAAFISFSLANASLLAVILMQQIYVAYVSFIISDDFDDTIDQLRENGDDFYYYFNGQLYTISNSTLVGYLEDLQDFIAPLKPATVVSTILAYSISIFGITNMMLQYKRLYLKGKNEGRNSEFVQWLWTFSPNQAISFIPAYYINIVFLSFATYVGTLILIYMLANRFINVALWHVILNRPPQFWVALVPTVLSIFYFPRLVTKQKYIRNRNWIALMDIFYLLLGIIGSVIKGIARFLTAFALNLLIGVTPNVSIFPYVLERKDNLYTSFHATILVQYLKEKYIPDFVLEMEDD